MDTLKRHKEVSRFIILVPHRDALKGAEDYKRRLFAAGFPGAYSFPLAASLASVSKPFSHDELKALAKTIRALTSKTDGKISGGGTVLRNIATEQTAEYLTAKYFLGVPLDIFMEENLFPESAKEKIISVVSPPLLCTAVLDCKEYEEKKAGRASDAWQQAPEISFRSAFVANLAVRPLPSGDARYSFEWRMGTEVWLAKHRAIDAPLM